MTEYILYGVPYLKPETVSQLKNLDHFSDFMLWSWATTETDIEMMFLEELGITYFDTKTPDSRESLGHTGLLPFFEDEARRAEWFLGVANTGKRYEYLKLRKMFSDPEKTIIGNFFADRKSLFHGNLFQRNVIGLTDKEKTEMMDNAYLAAFIVFKATLKVLFKNVDPPLRAENYMEVPPLYTQNKMEEDPKT